jgi:VanZ family protein
MVAGPRPELSMNVRPSAVLSAWFVRLLAAATASYTAILLFATHHPQPSDLVGDLARRDKALHFTAYGLLGLLVAATIAAAGRLSPRTVVAAVAGLMVFAAVDELTQPLFGRATELLDWVFDSTGIVAGFAAVLAAWAAVRWWRS